MITGDKFKSLQKQINPIHFHIYAWSYQTVTRISEGDGVAVRFFSGGKGLEHSFHLNGIWRLFTGQQNHLWQGDKINNSLPLLVENVTQIALNQTNTLEKMITFQKNEKVKLYHEIVQSLTLPEMQRIVTTDALLEPLEIVSASH